MAGKTRKKGLQFRSHPDAIALRLPPKDSEEDVVVTCDAVDMLDAGETISSVLSVDVSVVSGVDAAAATIRVGSAQIDGTQILQEFHAGIPNTVYHLRYKFTTSKGRTLVGAADLPVVKV